MEGDRMVAGVLVTGGYDVVVTCPRCGVVSGRAHDKFEPCPVCSLSILVDTGGRIVTEDEEA